MTSFKVMAFLPWEDHKIYCYIIISSNHDVQLMLIIFTGYTHKLNLIQLQSLTHAYAFII